MKPVFTRNGRDLIYRGLIIGSVRKADLGDNRWRYWFNHQCSEPHVEANTAFEALEAAVTKKLTENGMLEDAFVADAARRYMKGYRENTRSGSGVPLTQAMSWFAEAMITVMNNARRLKRRGAL